MVKKIRNEVNILVSPLEGLFCYPYNDRLDDCFHDRQSNQSVDNSPEVAHLVGSGVMSARRSVTYVSAARWNSVGLSDLNPRKVR